MPFEPALYRLKVKPDKLEDKTAGGIIIPENVKQMEQQATSTGVVMGVGPSSYEGKEVVKVGDRIMFAKYGGVIFKEDGIEYRFLNDEDLIAIER